MARARLLKIGFFENEVLAEKPPIVRLTFAGLWLLADRDGRLEDRPVRIRGQLFPYDTGVDVDDCLGQLAADGFIERYAVDGARYIWIPKFNVHQSPHMREALSKIPKRPAILESLGYSGASPVRASDKHSSSPAVSVSVSDPVPVSVSDPISETVTVSPKQKKSCSERELRQLARRTLELTDLRESDEQYAYDALLNTNQGRLTFSKADAFIILGQELQRRSA
jgi:hypothetical protein